MTQTDYTALDVAILEQIRAGCDPYSGAASFEAFRLGDQKQHGFRFIDRRLQALRKQGHIVYSRPSKKAPDAGWKLGEAA